MMRHFLIILSFIIAPATFAGSDQSAEEFLKHYLASYDDYLSSDEPDIGPVLSHFGEPFLQIPPQNAPRVIAKHEDFAPGLAYFINAMKKQGAARLEWETLQVVQFADNNALASNVAKVLDSDGETIDRRASLYSLYRSESGWKIVMAEPVAADALPVLRVRK